MFAEVKPFVKPVIEIPPVAEAVVNATAETALNAFSRPPVWQRPVNAEEVYTLFMIALLTCAGVRFGLIDNINAATPVTKGAACDVPFASAYWLFLYVLLILSPGANKLTEFAP